MIIRKIRPEELKRTCELFAVAFEFSTDIQKSPMEYHEQVSARPQSRDDAFWKERWAAFEDDDHTMMSHFFAQPFPVQFDGNTFTMTGIGGVSTLPQYRRRGGIRGCFEAALPAMYADGHTFSYLYPFSTTYYRKFGYEMGCEKVNYHVYLKSLPYYNVRGNCSLSEPGNLMEEEIRSVYRVWQNRYNMMVAAEDYEFAWIGKANPVKDQLFTYVYRSDDGTPRGYMTLQQAMEPDGRNISCSRFLAVDAEGVKGLLNLLISLGSDHSYASFDLPLDMDLSLILPEWAGHARKSSYFAGMVRAVNVQRILENARYQGNGRVSLAITDPHIPENTGAYTVTYAGGRAESVSRLPLSGQTSDAEMDINAFSRLILGACDVSSLPYMDHVKVCGNLPGLADVFYRKPNYITEHF